jgi:hypothetical protein
VHLPEPFVDGDFILRSPTVNEQLTILAGKRDCLKTRISLFNRRDDKFELRLTQLTLMRKRIYYFVCAIVAQAQIGIRKFLK